MENWPPVWNGFESGVDHDIFSTDSLENPHLLNKGTTDLLFDWLGFDKI